MQRWANTSLVTVDVKALLQMKIMQSDRKAEKMFSLYNQYEVSTRGRNLWSLYSAFTNYATYAWMNVMASRLFSLSGYIL